MKNTAGDVPALKQRLVKYEAMLNEMVDEKVDEKEREMRLEIQEKERLFKETEHSLLRQLNQTREQVIASQAASLKITEPVNHFPDQDSSKLQEMEIILVDLEQSHLKIAQLTRDNEELRSRIQEISLNPDKHEPLDSDIHEKYESLYKQVQELTTNLSEAKTKLSISNADNESMKTQHSKEIETLSLKLSKLDDYDKLKKELDVLKSIEFSTDGVFQGNEIESYSLERLMMERNKKLQNDITSLKLSVSDISSDLEYKSCLLTESNLKISQQSKLISKLEEDLHNLNNVRVSDPLSDISNSQLMSIDDRIPKSSENESIVKIVTSQRDRYRQRNTELEEVFFFN